MKALKTISNITEPLDTMNIYGVFKPYKYEEPLMIFHNDPPGIEILGHRVDALDGVNSIETLVEYLRSLNNLKSENEALNAQIEVYKDKLKGVTQYLEEKRSECAKLRLEEGKQYWVTPEENVYEDILKYIHNNI